jgi:hypothetical protein
MTLQTSLFEEYIDLSYTMNISAKVIGFYANERPNEAGDV